MSGYFASNSKTIRGFSTEGAERKRNTAIFDLDVINADLHNAFHTRVGERIMRPDYGCKIWDFFMEPLTDFVREQITQEAVRVCNLDSRVEVADVSVFELDAGLRVEIILIYRPYGISATFYTTFEQRQADYLAGQI